MVEFTNSIPSKLSLLRLNPISSFAVIGACVYVASFAAPLKFQWDIPLIVFSLFSSLSVSYSLRNKFIANSSFALLIAVFLITVGISLFTSKNVGRSLEFSAPLIPAILLYFVIAEHFNGTKDIRLLYLTFSIVTIGLSVFLLKAVFKYSEAEPFFWVSVIKSPILVVKNDVTFLSIATPLSLALLFCKPRNIVRVIAALSILLSLGVVGTFQSRVAMLTMVISITCFFVLIRHRIAPVCAVTSIALLLLIDGFTGFKLIERFVSNWDGSGRIPLWLSAWNMFLDAPVLGHGPHTFVLFYNVYLENLALPSWLFIEKLTVPWPHNLYLEVLSERGIVGLISIGLLLSYGLLVAWKSRITAPNETRILGCGAFAALIGFCFAAAFELTFLRRWVVIMMFTLLGIISQLSRFQKENRNEGG